MIIANMWFKKCSNRIRRRRR